MSDVKPSEPSGKLVLVDYENIGLSERRAELLWAILHRVGCVVGVDDVWVVGASELQGRPAAWLRCLGIGVDVLEYIRSGDGIKNGADIALTVRAVDTVTRSPVDRVALAAGDFDFRPLLKYLRMRGVHVTLLHTKNTNSVNRGLKLLSGEADQVVALTAFDAVTGRMTGLRPTGRPGNWADYEFPLGRMIPTGPGSSDVRAEILDELFDLHATTAPRSIATTLAAHDEAAEVDPWSVEALLTADDPHLSPRGQILKPHSDNNLVRLTTLNREDWVEEAYLLWIAGALAACVGQTRDPEIRAGVLLRGRQALDDDTGVATAWTRVVQRATEPKFATQAQRNGFRAPSDPDTRWLILSHLQSKGCGTGSDAPGSIPELTEMLHGAPAAQSPANASALLAALVAATPEIRSDWVTVVDSAWLAQILTHGTTQTERAQASRLESELKRHYLEGPADPTRDREEIARLAVSGCLCADPGSGLEPPHPNP